MLLNKYQRIELIGSSLAIRELRAEVDRIRRSDAKVLITGESGVGKEIVARAVGTNNNRTNVPFVPVNCAGIPETLLESELFGHVRGSFTGAYRDKPGKLEMASDGVIFLDEIGEMTLRMQGLLLRFLETGEIQKVGAERITSAANVRVVTATNRNLRDLIAKGLFREDLFYRINVIHLRVPPLRERREDIPLLIDYFLRRFAGSAAEGQDEVENGDADGQWPFNGNELRSSVRGIDPQAVEVLCNYSWPGNVRQLENVIERLVVTCRHACIGPSDLPVEVRTPPVALHKRRKPDRRKTIVDVLLTRLREERESFWTVVYPLYMNREITRSEVRELVHRALAEARGNYKIVLALFNMEPRDYKRFLNFLRKHDCQLPFKQYRQLRASGPLDGD